MGSAELYKLWSQSGRSQSSVARATGLRPCTISQVLRGTTGASVQSLAAICDVLGATDAQAGRILREMATGLAGSQAPSPKDAPVSVQRTAA